MEQVVREKDASFVFG